LARHRASFVRNRKYFGLNWPPSFFIWRQSPDCRRRTLPLEEVPLAQDHVMVLSKAKEKLVAHCHVVAERLAEGWKPWSSNDIVVLIQVGKAITVLDRLIEQEPTVTAPSTVVSSELADVSP
jgi:hypothetical protein